MEAAFPALVAPVAYSLRSSALTVAGPLRTCTGFPYKNRVVRFIRQAVEGSQAFPDASLGGITKRRSSRSIADRAGFLFLFRRAPENQSTLITEPRKWMATASNLEELFVTPEYRLMRTGRFLITELLTAHRVLSTSVRNGGQTKSVRYLVNHQSCEGTDHHERHALITGRGGENYHDAACGTSVLTR